MTTTTSSSHRSIPTPRIHSSIDTNRKTSNSNHERHSILNIRDSKMSPDEKILYPNEIIIKPQIDNKNFNFSNSPITDLSIVQSEQIVKTKYNELLVNFFGTHQPSFIFEPLRKEYFWTDQPFDEEKITRLEKLLHSTSYFVQSLFWYLRILLAICVTIPIEIIHTVLDGLVKPILIRVPIILSDTFIKPFYSGLFNALILPIGILLWNTSDLLSKTFEPFIRLLCLLFEPCVDCFRFNSRMSPSKQIKEQNIDHGDGHYQYHLNKNKSTLDV